MGVIKKIIKAGQPNTQPRQYQKVTLHYKGLLTNGKQFDTSVGKRPFTFTLGAGQVIKGWDEGVAQMNLGEVATFEISPDYGYGARGSPPTIPPNAPLIFHVQLLAINN